MMRFRERGVLCVVLLAVGNFLGDTKAMGLKATQFSNDQSMMVHPHVAPALGMVAKAGLPVEDAAQKYPFNGGGLTIPGMFGASGGIGWGLGGLGVQPGFVDATRWGLPADYLLPRNTPAYWQSHADDYMIPLYQGSHIFSHGGFHGMRGPSLQRYRARNPDAESDPQRVLLNPLNHPKWFFPNEPAIMPYGLPNSQVLNSAS